MGGGMGLGVSGESFDGPGGPRANALGVLVESFDGTGMTLRNAIISANTASGAIRLAAVGGGDIDGSTANLTAADLLVRADGAASIATLNSSSNNVNRIAAALSA